MVEHVGTHLRRLFMDDVGRIRHDDVPPPVVCRSLEGILIFKVDLRPEPMGIVAGDEQGVGRHVPRRHLGIHQVQGQCHGNTSAARAHVEHPQRGGWLQGTERPVVIRLDGATQFFGLGSRDEHSRGDPEPAPAEVGPADDILYRFAVGKARHHLIQSAGIIIVQGLHAPYEDVGHRHAERFVQQQPHDGLRLTLVIVWQQRAPKGSVGHFSIHFVNPLIHVVMSSSTSGAMVSSIIAERPGSPVGL